jgi:hypothetical protein
LHGTDGRISFIGKAKALAERGDVNHDEQN